jgi:DNA-binding CsgD family transcriptional regulator
MLPDGPATEFGQKGVKSTVIARQLAAELALDEGDLEGAREWITAHDRWLEWSGAALGRAEGQLLWTRFHHLAGDIRTAYEHAERALVHASEPRQPLALIAAYRYLGQLATEAEWYSVAADHLQASLALAERCEAPYEQALAMLEYADLAARTDDTDEVQRLLREARVIFTGLRAERSLERADRIDAELGTPTSEHPAGLSDREVEVLEQAATGMTNAEIGDALYISRRTVAQHLHSVYTKLGVNNRAAAVGHWVELKNT